MSEALIADVLERLRALEKQNADLRERVAHLEGGNKTTDRKKVADSPPLDKGRIKSWSTMGGGPE